MRAVTFTRRAALAFAAAWVVLAGSPALQAQTPAPAAGNISGAWVFDVVTEAGGGTPTVTFKQEGEKLTGHYSSMTFGEQDFTGEVKGKEFTFKFPVPDVGEVTYKGTIESSNALKGTMSMGELGAGTFTAERKKD